MPIHNYPRTQNGVCAGCDCADDSGGAYYAALYRVNCDSADFISWTLCNVPEAWHNWVQASNATGQGSGYTGTFAPVPGGEKFRIVPGQSDHLGIPQTSCWAMTTSDSKKSGCFENQIDFQDVFDDFGYDVPADVPESGYVDSSGSAEFSECCDDNVTDGDFYPLIPKRYVLKFRNRGLKYSGTFWMSSTVGLEGSRPPTIGSFNNLPVDYYCSFFNAGFETDGFFGGNHRPMDFGVKDWHNWHPEATIGFVDVYHGQDECFPSVPDSSYPVKARVWWPTQQVHVDHEWEMEAVLDEVESISGGWKATYINESAEWCYGDITTDSVCADPTAGGPAGAVAQSGMWEDDVTPASWCDYQNSPPPYGSSTVKVPRNISQIRGDGLKISGTLKVEVCFMLPLEGDVPGLCDDDSEFRTWGYQGSGEFGSPDCRRVSYPSSQVTAKFYLDDEDDFEVIGTAGPPITGSSDAFYFAHTQVIGPGCVPDDNQDYYCHFAGSCPGDQNPDGAALLRWSCFPTRFMLRPYLHRALDTNDCGAQGGTIDHDLVSVAPNQNNMIPVYGAMRGQDFNFIPGVDNGWVHEDYIPEPGVDSQIYAGTPWEQAANLRFFEMVPEYRARGCGGLPQGNQEVNDAGRHADGRVSTGMPHAHYPYDTWTVHSECRCKRVDGSTRVSVGQTVYDNYTSGFAKSEPYYAWADNHLIFEPHWD